jgi:hypothetical protein
MTPMTIVAVSVATVVDAEHAIDTSNDTADARTNRAADCSANRPRGTITFTNALVGSALHASDDTLRVGCDRQCEDGQRRGHKRKAPVCRREHEQGFSLHHENLQTGRSLRLLYNALGKGKLRQVWRKHATNKARSRNCMPSIVNLKTKRLLKKPLSMLY